MGVYCVGYLLNIYELKMVKFWSLARNCMTGENLDEDTKRIFYEPKPVVKPLNKRFGILDLLDSWESPESSESSDSSESLKKPYKPGKPGRPNRMESCDF